MCPIVYIKIDDACLRLLIADRLHEESISIAKKAGCVWESEFENFPHRNPVTYTREHRL